MMMTSFLHILNNSFVGVYSVAVLTRAQFCAIDKSNFFSSLHEMGQPNDCRSTCECWSATAMNSSSYYNKRFEICSLAAWNNHKIYDFFRFIVGRRFFSALVVILAETLTELRTESKKTWIESVVKRLCSNCVSLVLEDGWCCGSRKHATSQSHGK